MLIASPPFDENTNPGKAGHSHATGKPWQVPTQYLATMLLRAHTAKLPVVYANSKANMTATSSEQTYAKLKEPYGVGKTTFMIPAVSRARGAAARGEMTIL